MLYPSQLNLNSDRMEAEMKRWTWISIFIPVDAPVSGQIVVQHGATDVHGVRPLAT